MNEEKDIQPSCPPEEASANRAKEAAERQKEAAEAARFTREQRENLPEGEVGKEHPHEGHEIVLPEDRPPKLTVFKILKYVLIGVLLFAFILLLYRIFTQKKDYADLFVWTDEALAAYEEKGSLTVWTQDMSSLTLTLERDENNIPTKTYSYTYYPYSGSEKRRQFDGCFMVSSPMYIEETGQLLITFRVNRTAGDKVRDYYSLDHSPQGDVYRFLLSDGAKNYSDYEYITFEKNSYFYYRLVFNDVPYDYAKSYIGVTESDITELTLSVYYSGLYNINSPLETMTAGNNLIHGDPYKIQKALPAKKDASLKKGPAFATDEEARLPAEKENP